MGCKSVFITATGTDVGKTYFSALLVKKMRDLGHNCGYYKPALSGATRQQDGTLLPGDCDYVVSTSGLAVEPLSCVSYCFEEAVSPHLAAHRQGVQIDKEIIKKDYSTKTEIFNYLVVEGAGGITCPFNLDNEKILLPDIIKSLNLDILIVADAGLGTINSVILTVEYAKSNNLSVRGIVLNNYDENNFMHVDNKIQIERLTGIKVVAEVGNGDKELNISTTDLLKIFG